LAEFVVKYFSKVIGSIARRLNPKEFDITVLQSFSEVYLVLIL